MTPHIAILAETPHLETVAGWLHAQWWAMDGHDLAATRAFLAAARGPAAPLTLVAEAGGQPLGTATLDIDDLTTRPDLTPWMASVLVAPAARGQGVASALIAEITVRARALGHAGLFLFTSDQAAFYAKRGWRSLGTESWRGQPVTLMRRDLTGT
jgi:predicted N-acetyltransferase YhbS